jgi:hypothetical protein
MNSKTAFRNTLQLRNQGRKVFVPLLYSLAARVTQVPLKEMAWDATYYAHSLEASYELFKQDAIITCYDTSIELESCGCELTWPADFGKPDLGQGPEEEVISPDDFVRSGRIPVLMEATRRLVLSLGKETAIVSVVTGPFTFLKHLQAHHTSFREMPSQQALAQAGSLLAKFVRCLCELKVDAVFLREDRIGGDFWEDAGDLREAFCSVYKTLFNIVRFFNGFPVVVLRGFAEENLKDLCRRLRPSGVVPLGTDLSESALALLQEISEAMRISFGLPLPVGREVEEGLGRRLAALQTFMERQGSRGFFYTTDGEIPHDSPIERIHHLMKTLGLNGNT